MRSKALLGLRTGKTRRPGCNATRERAERQALPPGLSRALGLAYEGADRLAERGGAGKIIHAGEPYGGPLLELARVATKQKDYQGALGYLAHARDLEPKNAGIHYYFGLVVHGLEPRCGSAYSFEKAVQIEPENPEYNYGDGGKFDFPADPGEAVAVLLRNT